MFNKVRLLTPGPTPLPERVRLALAQDMIHHRKREFAEIMRRVQEKLRLLFGTEGPVLPLSCSGTGAMTAAVYSLFEPGDKVLVVEGGKFGERWRNIAASRGLAVASLRVPWGEAVRPEDVAAALDADPSFKGVLIQVCETSTGVLHPVRQVADLMVGREALLVADGISAVGISPCPMDEWKLDCLLTGSQKGLMLPPGLALLALSPRAWKKAEATRPGCFYFDLPRERDNVLKGQTLFTTPVNLIVGLDASLDLLLENGLELVYAKQWALTMLVRAGTKAMGLSPLAREHFAWGLTSVWLPEGVNGGDVLRLAMEDWGVCMAGGQDQLKGRIVRIGHMGWVDWADALAGLYALDRGLIDMGGYSAARDYLETAMAAYRGALEAGPGVLPHEAEVRS
ncbi:alanine--glyoxylate aminotransferase family protein [Desulfovibrio sp.]|uniref:pyridoxal-phosphate-dependent aminotransferase family protein n=1 Tax=Desulfovibrio sp. TaxID=885 RepID=UPI0023D2EAF6|nr:alanine--glyoxylate aminotransferase family protein [Desulfovibrio sp.]MDE7242019.1 alanine--glyoxylate aminotransferase family protein [Desulfovibrio sp.]